MAAGLDRQPLRSWRYLEQTVILSNGENRRTPDRWGLHAMPFTQIKISRRNVSCCHRGHNRLNHFNPYVNSR
jgi:hypothetical protein